MLFDNLSFFWRHLDRNGAMLTWPHLCGLPRILHKPYRVADYSLFVQFGRDGDIERKLLSQYHLFHIHLICDDLEKLLRELHASRNGEPLKRLADPYARFVTMLEGLRDEIARESHRRKKLALLVAPTK